MPTAYSLAMLGFFVVGAAAGGWCGYRIGAERGTAKLRERVNTTLGLLQRRMTTLEEAVSVAAEAERILRQLDNDKDGPRD
jgi:hypothetical protein